MVARIGGFAACARFATFAAFAAFAACALAWAAAIGACVEPPRRLGPEHPTACPTIANETHAAFLVHGARVLDGDRVLQPADVLVAYGQIIAVGADICFRATGGSVSYIDGVGATLLAAVYDDATRRLSKRGRIAPGERADLVLIADDANPDVLGPVDIRAMWRRGVARTVAP